MVLESLCVEPSDKSDRHLRNRITSEMTKRATMRDRRIESREKRMRKREKQSRIENTKGRMREGGIESRKNKNESEPEE